jgi:hypothetical protein
MNAALQSPASLAGAVAPAAPDFFDAMEAGRVEGLHPALRLGRTQAHLFPLAWARLVTFATRWRGADHGAVGFGHHVSWTAFGQDAEALRGLGSQLYGRSSGVLEGGVAHRRGAEFKSVMLFELLAAATKGMLRPKVAQGSLQAPRFAARANTYPRREGSQVAAPGRMPDPLLDGDQPKDAPPAQGFFFAAACRTQLAAIRLRPALRLARPIAAWRRGLAGYATKKHFATFDVASKAPGLISTTSAAVGVFGLAIEYPSKKHLSAAFLILGLIAMRISLCDHKKEDYNEAGIEITNHYNRLKKLYYDMKASEHGMEHTEDGIGRILCLCRLCKETHAQRMAQEI